MRFRQLAGCLGALSLVWAGAIAERALARPEPAAAITRNGDSGEPGGGLQPGHARDCRQ